MVLVAALYSGSAAMRKRSSRVRTSMRLIVRHAQYAQQVCCTIHKYLQGVAMTAEAVKKLWEEFDDLASKSENEDIQFLIRAIKLHAEVMNSHFSALEAIASKSAKHPTK
ncbi:hypothetical protein [Cupriavidus basilensis]|jgi:hydroxypyruvate isomerase|uniref:hypothetical protein n=2 Tax=Cupriavidus TaxID=106589 RepID=UPI0020A6D7AC|nr:hypothetical protein [Cupriavidus basilensis]MCP3022688.1 hypothetical protein [Cupriavidus basilensis]MDR3381133.1 hypothetical protein [Cupriavidus basilensis]